MRAMIGAGALILAGPAMAGSHERDPAHDVWGLWYTPKKDSVIHIQDCGDGTPCGVVEWVDPHHAEVTTDIHNDDEALRGRPIEGITLLHGFETDAEGWVGGEIYHPGNGHTYRAKVRRVGESTLEVKGCLGPICKGQLWDRAEGGAD